MKAAMQSGRPKILVYYRTETPPSPPMSDPDYDEKRRQWEAVKIFIAGFRNPDGSYKGGYNPYETTTQFGGKLDGHLRTIVRELLELSYLGRDVGDAPRQSVPSGPASPTRTTPWTNVCRMACAGFTPCSSHRRRRSKLQAVAQPISGRNTSRFNSTPAAPKRVR